MSQQIIKTLCWILLCMSFIALSPTIHALKGSDSPKQTQLPKSLFQKKLDDYRRLYPEILFLHFEGGSELLDEIMALDIVLGYKPRNMDYEHPPHLREDLMIVSVERIIQMLRNQAPSASLFQADTPLGWQEYVCVLTLTPENTMTSPLQATGYLLALPEQSINSIPHDLLLQPQDYLEFVFDHEVYHCLKSMYAGPQLQSHKEFWAEYNHFIDEQGADAYALAMHIKSRGKVSLFGKNLQRIRCLSLYGADPDHLTSNALEQILSMPVTTIMAMEPKEIFALANRIKKHLTIDYKDYVQYLSSSLQAMQALGVAASLTEPLQQRLQGIAADPAIVNRLLQKNRACLSEFRTGE